MGYSNQISVANHSRVVIFGALEEEKAVERKDEGSERLVSRTTAVGKGAIHANASKNTSRPNSLKGWMKRAQEGDVHVQYHLGKMFRKGDRVPRDFVKALHYYRLAEHDPKVQCDLARMYQKGTGVQQSDHEAFRLYHLAAEQGDPVAQYNVGVMYRKGQGVEKDDTKAREFIELSAQQNFPQAKEALSRLHQLENS